MNTIPPYQKHGFFYHVRDPTISRLKKNFKRKKKKIANRVPDILELGILELPRTNYDTVIAKKSR